MTYEEFKSVAKDWKTEPISPTCGVLISTNPVIFCDKPTNKAYPAHGGGWMALCFRHGMKHKEAFNIETLILKGEKFQ